MQGWNRTVLLKGGQSINLPSVGCKQHATPCPPKILSPSPSPSVLLLLDTLACNIVHGKSTASEWRAIDSHPEHLKLPDPVEEPCKEAGGVWSALQESCGCMADMPYE
jgi:hypothetical protein